jgi:hypothetical protein
VKRDSELHFGSQEPAEASNEGWIAKFDKDQPKNLEKQRANEAKKAAKNETSRTVVEQKSTRITMPNYSTTSICLAVCTSQIKLFPFTLSYAQMIQSP